MCGVLVHIRAGSASPPVDPARWRRAMDRLARRGPDGQGMWTSPSGLATLGHTRLAINDLSAAGAQPMVLERDQRGPLTLVANGEIYNAPELRKDLEGLGCQFRSRSDCEVLLHAADRHGFAHAIEAAYGMFAAVVWDDHTRTLHAAVDHAGMKPLVYAVTRDGIILASDADAVVAMLPERPALDADALAIVLAAGYCPAPRTVWAGIRKLGPGERLEWRPGGPARVARWWRPPGHATGPADADVQDEQFAALWSQVLREHLLADVPVGVFLSGGLDSSAVAAGLVEGGAARDDVAALTLALDSADDESPAAAATAAHLGLPHHRVPMSAAGLDAAMADYAASYDEPQGYGALLTAVALAKAVRSHGPVMLAGDGGDEAFAGYTWHAGVTETGAHGPCGAESMPAGGAGLSTCLAAPPAARCSAWAAAHLARVLPRWQPAELHRLLAPLGACAEAAALTNWAAAYDIPSLAWPRRAQAFDLMTFCAGSILPKVDRAAMGVGLEVRAPFLDRRILEWALSLPPAAGEGEPGAPSKPVVRRYLAPRIPPAVLQRPKQGFSLRLGPDAWTAAAQWLPDSRLIRDGLVHEHWRQILAGPQHAGKRQALVMLAAWWEARA